MRADRFVRRMPEVRLQTGEIVEVDLDQEIRGIRGSLLVLCAVGHTPADAYSPHDRNLTDGLLEGLDESFAVARVSGPRAVSWRRRE